MASSKFGIVPSFLESIIQVPINKKLHPFLESNLIAANSPIHFCLLAGVETVNVDECSVTSSESVSEVDFTG
jgi:hypothetical protein